MTHTLTKHHPASPNGHDDNTCNSSGNEHFQDVLALRLSRRSVLKGGFGLAASTLMGEVWPDV